MINTYIGTIPSIHSSKETFNKRSRLSAPAQPSRLLQLPAELRNKIFELALTHTNWGDGLRLHVPSNNTKRFLYACSEQHESIHRAVEVNQLKYVNKQLWKETAGLEVKYNSVIVCARQFRERPTVTLLQWLSKICTTKLPWIKMVVIKYEVLADAYHSSSRSISSLFHFLSGVHDSYDGRGRDRSKPPTFPDSARDLVQLVQFCRNNSTLTVHYKLPTWNIGCYSPDTIHHAHGLDDAVNFTSAFRGHEAAQRVRKIFTMDGAALPLIVKTQFDGEHWRRDIDLQDLQATNLRFLPARSRDSERMLLGHKRSPRSQSSRTASERTRWDGKDYVQWFATEGV
jgi:hypothetical protein